MSVNAILAMDSNMGIGWDNSLPWPHNKKDMKWFRECTSGHVVVMGRNTWESFGCKPLPNRTNIVISSNKPFGNPDVWYSGDMQMIIEELVEDYPGLHIFVIGGANIYRQALPFCDKLYVTQMHSAFKCDTFMHNSDFEGFSITEYVDAEDDNLTIQIRGRA